MDRPGLHVPGLPSAINTFRYVPRIPPKPTNCAFRCTIHVLRW